jgi:zinc protease
VGILDGGDSARLSKHLIRGSKIATTASASYSPNSRMQTLFSFSAVPAKNVTTEVLKQALLIEIDHVKNNLVSDGELQRVKAQVISSAVYEQDSMFYQAMKIGIAETVGIGWQEEGRYVERIKSVTAKQVQQVAQKYLIAQTLTEASLKPLDKQAVEQVH